MVRGELISLDLFEREAELAKNFQNFLQSEKESPVSLSGLRDLVRARSKEHYHNPEINTFFRALIDTKASLRRIVANWLSTEPDWGKENWLDSLRQITEYSNSQLTVAGSIVWGVAQRQQRIGACECFVEFSKDGSVVLSYDLYFLTHDLPDGEEYHQAEIALPTRKSEYKYHFFKKP